MFSGDQRRHAHTAAELEICDHRNALDGSDNNDPLGVLTGAVNSSPFGYFCDDLLGAWIVTYFWWTVDPANPGPACAAVMKSLAAAHGLSTDGTPIIITGDELDNQVEANGCGAEGNEDPGGADGGAVWIICPGLLDPRNGAIAPDAFLDQVLNANGQPQDPNFGLTFKCLQTVGQFPGPADDGRQPTGACQPPTGNL